MLAAGCHGGVPGPGAVAPSAVVDVRDIPFVEKFGFDALDRCPEGEAFCEVALSNAAVLAVLDAPELPESPDFFDSLIVRPARRVALRPVGVPWYLPGELGTTRNTDLPGPGVGLNLSWRPANQWRFGADFIVRAEQVDADYRLHDWTPYIAPGLEFIPYPNSKRSFSVGFVAPWAFYPSGASWAGAFVFIRWSELLNGPLKPRRE